MRVDFYDEVLYTDDEYFVCAQCTEEAVEFQLGLREVALAFVE